jgi:hypothetical protein
MADLGGSSISASRRRGDGVLASGDGSEAVKKWISVVVDEGVVLSEILPGVTTDFEIGFRSHGRGRAAGGEETVEAGVGGG